MVRLTDLEAATAQALEYLDSLQRERASSPIINAELTRENAAMAERLLGEHVKLFLPVVDDLERALKETHPIRLIVRMDRALNLIHKKLLKTLENHNVSVT